MGLDIDMGIEIARDTNEPLCFSTSSSCPHLSLSHYILYERAIEDLGLFFNRDNGVSIGGCEEGTRHRRKGYSSDYSIRDCRRGPTTVREVRQGLPVIIASTSEDEKKAHVIDGKAIAQTI